MALAVRDVLSPSGTAFTSDGTYTFPANITKVRAFLWGGGSSGAGAYLAVDILKGSRTTLTIQLNRGGGASGPGGGGGGAGYSAITTAGDGIIALAGGGGGSGGGFYGGGGGFFNASQGGQAAYPGTVSTANNYFHGGGGSQSAGGSGGVSQLGAGFYNGSAGSYLQGGGANPSTGYGGGGGGGYYGGGGGGGDANTPFGPGMGAGGGGSSYVSAVAINVEGQAGPNGAPGGVSPGGRSSGFWISPYGSSSAGGLVVVVPYLPVQQIPPQMRMGNTTPIPQSQLGIVSAFSYTGSSQTYTVPTGITMLWVHLWGAGGGGGAATDGGTYNGGAGAYVSGLLSVSSGETLTLIVGLGGSPNSGAQTLTQGGGGGAGSPPNNCSSGGGRSAIQRVAGTDIVVAGAGSGSGWRQGAGATWFGTSSNGTSVSGTRGGGGGTQTAGGFAGPVSGYSASTAGSKGQGGNGGGYASGGGGGWYGGGGGGVSVGDGGTGGAGSSYIDLLTSATGQNGGVPTAPATTSPYYASSAGAGGQVGSTTGGNGRIVLIPVLNRSTLPANQALTSYSYKYVRFTVLQARGGSTTEYQLSEFQLKFQGAFVNYTGVTISPNTTGAEGSIRVFDGNLGTKYFAVGQGNNFVLTSPTTFVFDSYTWGTANDVPDRDPVRWTVEGSTDNTNWTMLDNKGLTTQSVTTDRQVYLPDIALPPTSALPFTATYRTPSYSTQRVFSYTGGDQTFIVPPGVLSIAVYMWGAGGGPGGNGGTGGAGAMIQGTLFVRTGQAFTVIVGQGGAIGRTSYGGGGQGNGFGGGAAGAGGGRSALILSGTEIATAGGGGGAGFGPAQGGAATFSGTALDGSGVRGGKGASQVAGGAGGTGGGASGSARQGGNGAGMGGGGGGGYFGGGGGGDASDAGGGGGSSFTSNLSLVPGESVFGFNSSNGSAAPNTSSPYYAAGIGAGGGGNGRVVILY